MKKILAVFLAIIVLLGAYVFYQRQQVSGSLKELLKGKTYSSYGVKIEIPPSEGKVQGLLKPYVNIPKVFLDLTTFGVKQPIAFENATASRKLWSQGGILLEIPQEISGVGVQGIKVVKPHAELTSEGSILSFASEAFEFAKASGENQKIHSLKIFSPQLLIEKSSPFPNYKFSWSKLFYQEGEKSQVEAGPLNFGFSSQSKDGRRQFGFTFQQQGGSYQDNQYKGKFGAIEYSLKGHLRDLTEAEAKKVQGEMEKLQAITLELYRELFASTGAGLAVIDTLMTDRMPQVFEQTNQILAELDMRFKDMDISWQGLTQHSKESEKAKFVIKPLKIHQDFEYFERGFGFKATGFLEEIEIISKENSTVLMRGFNYRQDSKYEEVSFLDLTKLYIRNIKENSLLFSTNREHNTKGFLIFILGYLTQYPNQQHFFFGVDQLEYRTAEFEGKHQNSALTFYMEPEKVGYELKGDFDWRYLNTDPKRFLQAPIEGGKVRLAIDINLPWNELLKMARRTTLNPPETATQILKDLAAIFTGKKTDYNLGILADLGKNYFNFNWDTYVSLPLGASLNNLELPEDLEELEKKFDQQLMPSLRHIWLTESTGKTQMNITHFSKFQKFLDETQPGASLGLTLAAPYVQIDAKADTLKSEIEYKNKQFWVNGVLNQTLNDIWAPYLAK